MDDSPELKCRHSKHDQENGQNADSGPPLAITATVGSKEVDQKPLML